MSGLARNAPGQAGPTRAREGFSFSAGTRVAFSDTDAQGIVYYGRYAPYFDLARVEYWRHLSETNEAVSGRGDFVMRAFNIVYHAPARFDDPLEVFCTVQKLGHTSMTFEFDVLLADGADRYLASATQTLVNVDLSVQKPVPIEPELRAAIDAFEQRAN